MITKNIRSIGLEVECGMLSSMRTDLRRNFPNLEIYDDASVTVWSDHDIPDNDSWDNSVEVTFWHTEKEMIKKFINFMFASKIEQNSTCGNHVHVKFYDMDKAVGLFSTKRIRRKFIEEYTRYAMTFPSLTKQKRYLDRLKNGYCKGFMSKDNAVDQLLAHDKVASRYKAVNLSAVNIYGTIEFRILPYVESVTEFMSNLNWLVKTIEKLMTFHFTEQVETFDLPMQDFYDKEYTVDMPKLRKNYTVRKRKLKMVV